MSVTDATTTCSSRPGETGGVMSSRRRVRPDRASHSAWDPIRPDPPVITMIGTAVEPTRSPAADTGQDHDVTGVPPTVTSSTTKLTRPWAELAAVNVVMVEVVQGDGADRVGRGRAISDQIPAQLSTYHRPA